VEVTGKATVDGKPLTSKACTLMFAPDKDNPLKKIAAAELDANGVYRLSTGAREGVPLGWYKVYVDYDARQSKGAPPPINSKYFSAETTPLSIEVVTDPKLGAYDLKFEK
jgi:hypothetical protein